MQVSSRLPILALALTVIAFGSASSLTAKAQTVTVSIDTTRTLTVPPRTNFAGANMMIMNTGTSYKDAAMQSMVESMHLGWVRFPGGTADDAWDQSTGTMNSAWVSQFSADTSTYNALNGELKIDGGKQDKNSVTNFASFVSTQTTGSLSLPGTSLTHYIGVVNAFTDTSTSAAALVTSAKNAGLSGLDDVWELGNEPVYFTDFFATPADYLNKVQPYATAIKGVESTAKVAVWVDPKNDSWTQAVASYSTPFWDQLYTHQYPTPPNSLTTAAQFVSFYNEFLLDSTNTLFDTTFTSLFPSNYQMEISEYNIAGNSNLDLKSTEYNAVFVAEYLLRLASDPHITHAGMHLAVSNASSAQNAVVPTNDYTAQCKQAYSNGTTINTADSSTYNFGYYMAAPGMALEVIDQAINSGTGIWPTTTTGGSYVSYNDGNGTSGPMPAVYAQAVEHQTNPQHLLLTNKSGTAQTVNIKVNGTLLSGTTFSTTYITATAPDSTSTSIQTGSSTGSVTLPPYSVMNVAWAN